MRILRLMGQAPRAGTTTIAANLATLAAQSGTSVVLVDIGKPRRIIGAIASHHLAARWTL